MGRLAEGHVWASRGTGCFFWRRSGWATKCLADCWLHALMFPVGHGSRSHLASLLVSTATSPCPSPFPMPWALFHRANRVGTLTVADPSRLPLCPPVSVSRTCRLFSPASLRGQL
eukprot:scaffold12838_cov144-Isochrysis_galbana.AAC.2